MEFGHSSARVLELRCTSVVNLFSWTPERSRYRRRRRRPARRRTFRPMFTTSRFISVATDVTVNFGVGVGPPFAFDYGHR